MVSLLNPNVVVRTVDAEAVGVPSWHLCVHRSGSLLREIQNNECVSQGSPERLDQPKTDKKGDRGIGR